MALNEILAVIPARSGSKGIPNKNIRPFANKPLLVHAIETAKAAPSVSRVIVSTDDAHIADIARSAGAEVPFLRPKKLAGDTSNVIEAVTHLIEKLSSDEGYMPSHILLLQPTNPLRTSHDIEGAVSLLRKRKADSVVSVCRTENLLFTKEKSDGLTILNPDLLQTPNRQELPAYYRLDGSMTYLIKTQTFLAEKSFLAGKLVGYEIEKWRAIDIDEPEDFVLGEFVFEHRDSIAERIKNFDA